MSWSFYAIGRAPAVSDKARADFAQINCSEPEQTIKNKVANIIDISLGAMPANTAVKIEAAGSQSSLPAQTDGGPQRFINSVNLKIETIYGFVG